MKGMAAKTENVSPETFSINKQILEIKKKIQLAEGQRKSLFEICENERKQNVDEILKLNKEISQLVVKLHRGKCTSAKYKIKIKKKLDLLGPFTEKDVNEVEEYIDLHIIDKTKQLDLIYYRIGKRKEFLEKIGKEYQALLSDKDKIELENRISPIKKTCGELESQIHAVGLQLKEAKLVRDHYRNIKKSLLEDNSRYDSNIRNIEEKLKQQNDEISRLQEIMNEAAGMRSKARNNLLHEERMAMSSTQNRNQQIAEGKRLLNMRKRELEILEKRIFQSGKTPIRQEPEGAEDNEEEPEETPLPPGEIYDQAFNSLKQVTGGTSTEEVLKKFKEQKNTSARLLLLRKNLEDEKRKLEEKLERLNNELIYYKYAESKGAERKSIELEQIEDQINEEKQKSDQLIEKTHSIEKSLKLILKVLQNLHRNLNPLANPEDNCLNTLKQMTKEIEEFLKTVKINEQKEEEENVTVNIKVVDEKWLPPAYSGVVRRTPLPQQGSSPAPPASPGSDDEEEVPSRGYLKRQAQLITDTKRRKNVRIPRH